MSDRREFLDLVDPAVAREAIASFEFGSESESISLDDADGRVLAERVDASMDVPGFDRASKDGYAVRAADTVGAGEQRPVELDCVDTVHAGEKPRQSVEPGTCIEVSTGAVCPPGADAVVMVEYTSREGDTVGVRTAVTPGQDVMPAGDDVAAGERALGPGTVLTAREIGLLAALGRKTVPVRVRPRVAIISTGAELVALEESLDVAAGEIYDVNARTIAAGTRDAGGEPQVASRVPDDEAELTSALEDAAADADLVLTSGSTSAGAVDVLADVVDGLGNVAHHGVAIKPGKPTLIGHVGETPYVGLPGYPVSALSIFRTFVAPKIRDAAGRPPLETPRRRATMAERLRYEEGRTRLLPVGLVEDGGGQTLAYTVDKGSGATTSLTRADGVVEIPAERTLLEDGDPVTVELFGSDVTPPRLLGVGEDDPVLSRLLDSVQRVRYLPVGSEAGGRRLVGGIPDVAVVTGDPVDGERLGGWTRRWGLVTRNAAIDGLENLVDENYSFVNRTRSGLRTAFDDTVEAFATARGEDMQTVRQAIHGYDQAARGHEAPARRVLDGRAEVGLGLESTATRLGLDFVPLGEQPVHVVASDDRLEKPAVQELRAVLDGDPEWVADFEGVAWEPS